MKKIFIAILMILLLTNIAYAQVRIDFGSGIGKDLPPSTLSAFISTPLQEKIEVQPAEPVSFEVSVVGGVKPYTFAWTFCTKDCEPKDSTLQAPSNIKFSSDSTVSVIVTDANSMTATDSVIVQIVTGNPPVGGITAPGEESGWGVDEDIPFSALATDADGGTLTYIWDFGWDPDSPADNWVDIKPAGSASNPVGVQYQDQDEYHVTLSIEDDTGNVIQDSLILYAYDPLNMNFDCTMKKGDCGIEEIEMVRFSNGLGEATEAGHIKGFDDPDKDLFPFAVCCATKSLVQEVSIDEQEGTPITYAVISSVDHTVSESLIYKTFYQLNSYVGAGSHCQAYETGVNGKCDDYDLKCVYDYAPETGEKMGGSHIANCTDAGTPNFFGEKTWSMCCDITEDCTNNNDDDDDGLMDCADPDCHSGPSVCGVSTTIGTYEDHDPFGNPIVTTYYCSKGEKQYTNPLPAYLPDMQNDGYLTRHCCEQGTFWDPLTEQCQEGAFCYNPDNPEDYFCHYNFETELSDWSLDVFNPDLDCVNQENVDLDIPVTSCCPVNIYAQDDYDYVNIIPYIVYD